MHVHVGHSRSSAENPMMKYYFCIFKFLPGTIFSVDLCSFLKVGKSRNDVCVIAFNGVTIVKFVGST
jgi:hypothetical protein